MQLSRVCATAERRFERWKIDEAAIWCRAAGELPSPCKSDQDRLDAMLCLVVALHWRLEPADASIMIGDTANGYIVAPASAEVRQRLSAAALKRSVPLS